MEVPISNELQVVRTMPTMLYVFKQLPFRFRGLEFLSGILLVGRPGGGGSGGLKRKGGKVT